MKREKDRQTGTPLGYFSYSQTTPNPQITPFNEIYHLAVINHVLDKFYPVVCTTCNKTPNGRILSRPTVTKCYRCKIQYSRTANTPFRNTRVPLWMLGWCIDQSIIRYPNVLTASEICRQLGVAKNTGTMLKRRLQIFAMQQKEHIRSLMYQELQARYGNRRKLPVKDLNNLNMDVTKSLKDKRIPQADVSILWTARPSSSYNKRRGKHHGGAAIFRADSLGGTK